MVEAGGTTTIKQIHNVGDYTLWEIKNDSWDSGETITIPSTAPITTSTLVIIKGALEEDLEDQLADGELTVEYAKGTKMFTPTRSTASGDTLRILFYAVNE